MRKAFTISLIVGKIASSYLLAFNQPPVPGFLKLLLSRKSVAICMCVHVHVSALGVLKTIHTKP